MENLKIKKDDDSVVVALGGELTLELVEMIKGEVESIMQEGWKVLAFDLSDIKFMDSSGIGFLVATNNKVKQSGRGFYLYMPSPQVIKTLKLVNLFSFFEILRDEDDLVAVTPV